MAIETRLQISADDLTAAAFASVEARLKTLQATISQVNATTASIPGAGLGSFAPAGAALAEHADAMAAQAVAADKAAAAIEATGRASGGFLQQAAEILGIAEAMREVSGGVSQAIEQAHEGIRMEAAGMTPDEIAKGEALSRELAAKYPAIPLAEHMNMLRNARAIVGSYEDAAKDVDQLAQLRVVAMGANAKAGPSELSEEFDQLLKGIEIKGATQDPKEFKTYMEGIAKGLNAFGDTLRPFEYYQMMKYGRQATPMLSDEFMLGTAPALAQELKGMSYGRAVSAFNRAIVEGHDPHDVFRALAEWGLIKEEALDRSIKTGEIKGLAPGGHIEGWQLAQTDPNAWVRQFLLPAMAAHGITDKADVSAAIGRVFENQLAAQMVSILATQQPRIDKDLRLLAGAKGLESAELFAKQDPRITGQAARNAITNAIAQMVPTGGIAGFENVVTVPAPKGFHYTGPFIVRDASLGDVVRNAFGREPRRDVVERFPGAFGEGLDVRDAERLKRHAIEESYRRQAVGAEEPEARRGAVLMGMIPRPSEAPAGLPAAGVPGSTPGMIPRPSEAPAGLPAAGVRGSTPGMAPLVPPGAAHQSVSVSGEANVSQVISLDITLDPELRAQLDNLRNYDFSVPLQAPTGLMDSDASPQRGAQGQ